MKYKEDFQELGKYTSNKRTRKTKVIPHYQVKQNFLSTKFDKKKCAAVSSLMKNSVSPNVIYDALSELFHTIPGYEKIIWGNLFPSTVEELGKGNEFFNKPHSIWNEISWVLIQIKKYRKKLSDYCLLRDHIEDLILLGRYEEAHIILDESVRYLGYSIWFFETKMLIYSYQNREDKIIALISEINERKREDQAGFVLYLLYFLSKRCSRHTTGLSYDDSLLSKFQMTKNDFKINRFGYYLFRLNFYLFYNRVALETMFTMEATNSLVDRYQTLLYVLKAKFSQCDIKERVKISNIVKNLYKNTLDSQLLQLLAFGMNTQMPEIYYNDHYLSILNSYYQGDYQTVIKLVRKEVETNPKNFDLIKVYCRSLLFMERSYMQICTNSNSVLNIIAQEVYGAMSISGSEESLEKLYDINKNIYGLSIACGIDYFIKYSKNQVADPTLRYIYLPYFDPMFAKIWDDVDAGNTYLNRGEIVLGENLCISYQKKRLNKIQENILGVKKYIEDISFATSLFEKGLFDDSIKCWEYILAEHQKHLPIAQKAIFYIYSCNIKLGRRQQAISFYVDNYIKCRVLTAKTDIDLLAQLLYNEKYRKGVKNTIDLQIYVLLSHQEDHRKADVLERFMEYYDVEDMSQLINILSDNAERKKVELFLYLLASEDILRHVVYVRKTQQQLEEQQKIAQYLTELESDNHSVYEKLNQALIDEILVYQNSQKIDESKIYANITSIYKYDLKEYESLYNQYSEQLNQSKNVSTLYMVDLLNSFTGTNDSDSIIKANVKITNCAANDTASQLFKHILENFLFSKFGLKTYLSTRIRHGVFEVEMRSVFDRQHLVLATVGKQYMPITYWKNHYDISLSDHKELMSLLESFSRNVNHFIVKFKEDALQIKMKDDDKGMFDYRIDDNRKTYVVSQIFLHAKNYEEFCAGMMEYLFKYTEVSLSKIRNKIKTELTEQFSKSLESLDHDLKKFEGQTFYTELKTSVNNARKDINQRLFKIEKWFYIRDVKLENFYIQKQIPLVLDVIARMYPNVNYLPNLSNTGDDVLVASNYYLDFCDMLIIFYNNMFSYSHRTNVRVFGVASTIKGNDFHLHLENDIVPGSEKELNDKFKKKFLDYGRLQNEGNSGIVKVQKILKDDFKCSSNDVTIMADNGKCFVDVYIDLSYIKV